MSLAACKSDRKILKVFISNALDGGGQPLGKAFTELQLADSCRALDCLGSFVSNLVMFLHCQGSQNRLPDVFAVVLPELQRQGLHFCKLMAHEVCGSSWTGDSADGTNNCGRQVLHSVNSGWSCCDSALALGSFNR